MKSVLVVSMLAGAALPADAQSLLPFDDGERVASGARIYDDACASCHGEELEGEENWQERNSDGYLPAPPHDETGHTWHHADPLLVRIVSEGTEAIVGGDYKSSMMGFQDLLTEDEILDVLAYIKSTWPQDIIDIHNRMNEQAAQFAN